RRLIMRKSVCLLIVFVVGLLAFNCLAGENPNIPGLNGFVISDINADNSAVRPGSPQRPAVTIPKDWKLISVSNGGKPNCNTLWFQDAKGDVYMINGFTETTQYGTGIFFLDGHRSVQRLNAR